MQRRSCHARPYLTMLEGSDTKAAQEIRTITHGLLDLYHAKGVKLDCPTRSVRSRTATAARQRAKPRRPRGGTEPTKRLNVKLPEPLHERFREQCESEGRSMTWVITQFIEGYVSRGE